MKIGLTYDLRSEYLAAGLGEEETAEFDRDDTIDHIESALRALGHETDRIGHVRQLATRLVRGDRWHIVFNLAEGLHGVGREAQVPALLDAYRVEYTFSDPLVSALTLHKGLTNRVLRDMGIPTPDGHLVEGPKDVAMVRMSFPMFVKPVAEGTAKGVDAASKVHTHAELVRRCRHVVERYHQAALVEEYLPGREFTTSVIGTGRDARALGTLEIGLRVGAESGAYTYLNKERCEDLVEYTLADEAWSERCAQIALRAWRGLGCRDGGRVDLRCDVHGDLRVLEVNPLPGLHPEHSDLPMTATAIGMSFHELIGQIVESACRRTDRRGHVLARGRAS